MRVLVVNTDNIHNQTHSSWQPCLPSKCSVMSSSLSIDNLAVPVVEPVSGGNARQDMHLHSLGAGQSDGCALCCFHALGSSHLQAQQKYSHVSMHVLEQLLLSRVCSGQYAGHRYRPALDLQSSKTWPGGQCAELKTQIKQCSDHAISKWLHGELHAFLG